MENWVMHTEFLALLISIIGGFYLLDNKIERGLNIQSARSDKLYEALQAQAKSQGERSDQLYQMFVDLLKEKK